MTSVWYCSQSSLVLSAFCPEKALSNARAVCQFHSRRSRRNVAHWAGRCERPSWSSLLQRWVRVRMACKAGTLSLASIPLYRPMFPWDVRRLDSHPLCDTGKLPRVGSLWPSEMLLPFAAAGNTSRMAFAMEFCQLVLIGARSWTEAKQLGLELQLEG